MDSGEIQNTSDSISIAHCLGLYLIAIIVFFAGLAIAHREHFRHGGYLALAYIVLGICLNRMVLRRVVHWHRLYNTVDNVSRAKLRAVLFWPFSYPILFIRLAIIKFL